MLMTAIIDTSNTLFILNSLTHSSLSSSSLAHSLLFSVLVTYSLTHSILFLPDGTQGYLITLYSLNLLHRPLCSPFFLPDGTQGCTKPLFWLHADILHFTFTYTSCISAPRLTCKKAEAHTAVR